MIRRLAPADAGCGGLTSIFEAQVRCSPDAIAVSFGPMQLSYLELDRRANQVADLLLGLGTTPEQLVGLCLTRSIEMIVGMLGILKAGAAYLPLDLVYPKERLASLLADAGATLVLTLSGDRHALPATSARVICLDTELERATGADDAPPRIDHGQDALAYVIYTSGSTGMPKGCQVTHRNVVRLFTSTAPWFGFNQHDVWTCFHSHAFDFSVWEIWGALLHGGRLVIVPTAVSRAPATFRQLLIDQKVTILNQTPSAFVQLMRADEAEAEPGDYALREVILGGEALELQSLRPWIDRHGDARPRLVNMYGITETTVHVTYRPIGRADLDRGLGSVIGVPIPDLTLHVLDERLRPVEPGSEGELFVGGAGLSRGYLKRPELDAQRFIQWRAPDCGSAPGERLYRTGDLVRATADGELEYVGRIDGQVKIRGYRIEIGEIEATLARHPQVRACAVVAREYGPGDVRLVAYVVPGDRPPSSVLRAHLAATLPEYMLPVAFVGIDALPLTGNGKLDRSALPPPERGRRDLASDYEPPATPTEHELCAAYATLLEIGRVGRHDNFFDLGGNSLMATRLLERVRTAWRDQGRPTVDVLVTTLFDHPTPARLAAVIDSRPRHWVEPARLPARWREDGQQRDHVANDPIAIVAMAGRFPGAADVEAFWLNLCEGRDSITVFRPEELDPAVSSAERTSSSYVPARGVIDGVELFDAAFFGISPREAELMDPQQRVFLELCWECMERAGHVPGATPGPVGIFAGMFNASYFQRHVSAHPDLIENVGAFQVMLDNEKDFLATRVAHKLNLTGPAISVHTACSTSLVAICQAADSVRARQCDMALAGGISITCPPRSGYVHQDGAMLSPDGRTRSFDAQAQGTVFSDGASVVLLKRLSDAVTDGNEIFAVILGGAINNDGGDKASFTAPSSEGQAAVIAMAHDRAGVDPRSIGYVETHGTATPLGDPIEIAALSKAFRRATTDVGFCRIGSVKSNIGHLVTAAGGAGLIKTALALHERRIPASLHFQSPNPVIDFAASPFVVNAELTGWPSDDVPRRAGVSSFGVGGTNAHVVLEEAPAVPESDASVGPQLLVVSARTPSALGQACVRLAEFLQARPDTSLADVAWTLSTGRKAFAHRIALVADHLDQAIASLRSAETAAAVDRSRPARQSDVAFLFPGQGAAYAGMGRGLYQDMPVFRTAVDECAEILHDELGFDLRRSLFDSDPETLLPTSIMQPATFTIEYSLARLWMSQGIMPAAMIGHSVGEFVAATLAGTFTLPDALRLVARRGALMQAQPAGGMLSVQMALDPLTARLPPTLSLAAENAPGACVVAGPADAVGQFQAELAGEGVACRPLRTSHAFHSAMMEPVVALFQAEVEALTLAAPQLPVVSTMTGEWLDAETATSAGYWARHLREPVRFTTALGELLGTPPRVLLEVGPRAILSSFARRHPETKKHHIATVPTLSDSPGSEAADFRRAVGQLWSRGVALDPSLFDRRKLRHRIRLPTYPFQRKRYWLDAMEATVAGVPASQGAVHDTAKAAGERDSQPEQPSVQVPADTHVSTGGRADRRLRLTAQLREVFEDVTGFELADADPEANFIELGFDSLMLTQLALHLAKTFTVRITFRQLMGECASLDALAGLLDAQLPPDDPVEVLAATQPMHPPTPTGQSGLQMPLTQPPSPAMPTALARAPGDVLEGIARQMQLINRQLAMLAGDNGVAAAPGSLLEPTPSPDAAGPESPSTSTSTSPSRRRSAASGRRAGETPAEQDSPAQTPYDAKNAFGAIARIHHCQDGLTSEQRERLDDFSRRYIARTQGSRDYTQQHRSHLADPRVVNGFRPLLKEITYPIVVGRSQGSHLWDIDDNEYIDAANGFGMNLFGWQPKFVQDAIRHQLDVGYEMGPQHPLAGEVARLICEITGFERAGLCNTGSEAVLGTIRIARTTTGRSTLVIFSGSYHGIFDEVIVRGSKALRSVPAAPGILRSAAENVLVLDYGTSEALAIIRKRAHEIAAVLVEPVQSRRPEFQPAEFLHELRAITREAGAVLIFDEVVTGFRADPRGAQGVFGIDVDLAAYGKVLGGGLPIGVIAGKRQFMDALDGGHWQFGDDSTPTVGVTYFAGTFVRHPLALAAAKAVLEHIKAAGPALQQLLNARTAAMAAELNAFCDDLQAPIRITHFASLWRITFRDDHPLQDLLFAMMRSRGIHVLDNFPCFFTTAHSEGDYAAIATAFKESVIELQEAGFIPGARIVDHRVLDASRPPLPGARLGRDPAGNPAWFIADPQRADGFLKVGK